MRPCGYRRHGPDAPNRNLALMGNERATEDRIRPFLKRYCEMKMLRAIALVSLALVVAGCRRTTNFQTPGQTAMPQPTVLTNPLPDVVQPTDSTPIQQARL